MRVENCHQAGAEMVNNLQGGPYDLSPARSVTLGIESRRAFVGGASACTPDAGAAGNFRQASWRAAGGR